MRIGHTGHTRTLEVILALGLTAVAVRTAIPVGNDKIVAGIVLGALTTVPAMSLLAARARNLKARKTCLLWVFVTYWCTGVFTLCVDETRFGTVACLMTLAAIAAYLYFLAARELHWTKPPSQGSSPQSEGPSPHSEREPPSSK